MVHAVRMSLELHRNFICVTNDCKNAYNEVSRAAAIKELQGERSLAHLAYYAALNLIPKHGMEHRGAL